MRKTYAEVSARFDATLLTTLRCIKCHLDATVPLEQQTMGYTRSELDKHLEPDFHNRREQIKRLFCGLQKDDLGRFKCPCCSVHHPQKYRDDEEVLAHMESEHEEAMNS